MNIIKNKILYIEVFVNKKKKIINLPCEIKIEELDNDNCVINISNFTFNVETEVENLKWIKFEIKSILD
jgi:hypothetical protein